MTTENHIAQCLVELAASSGGPPPDWVRLMPAGKFSARDGRSWLLADADEVIARTRLVWGPTDMVVDYEHQTEHSPSNGQPAPAAGWIREIENRDGSIWARIEWTERAAGLIASREYRYISPSFTHDSEGVVMIILRAGLTNAPALDLPALARETITNPTTNQGETPMEAKERARLVAALGLADDASDDELAAAAEQLQSTASTSSEALASVASAVGVEGDPTAEAITAKFSQASEPGQASGQPDPGEFVPRGEFDAVSASLTNLQAETATAKAEAAVDAAVKAGKVTPAHRGWAVSYATSDPKGFAEYVEKAAVVVAPGETGGMNSKPDPEAALGGTDLAVCKMMGIEPEKFKESRADIHKTELAATGGAA